MIRPNPARLYLYCGLGKLGLLPWTDAIQLRLRRRQADQARRDFAARHPEVPLPPADLAFDAFGHLDWHAQYETGRRQARFFAQTVAELRSEPPPVDLVEWGCGPGRILRHLGQEPTLAGSRLSGCDINARSIDWCRTHLPGIEFAVCAPAPPLPYPDRSADVILASSVFTHLSGPMHPAWVAELMRVLRPGGILLASLHGDAYRPQLLPWERRRYDRGELVVRSLVREGRKAFAAFHPPAFVRETLFARYRIERHVCDPAATAILQDVWAVRNRPR